MIVENYTCIHTTSIAIIFCIFYINKIQEHYWIYNYVF